MLAVLSLHVGLALSICKVCYKNKTKKKTKTKKKKKTKTKVIALFSQQLINVIL
jgi:hypothetical protein